MRKQTIKNTFLLMGIIALISLIWDSAISAGVILGTIASIINLMILDWYLTGVLKERNYRAVSFGILTVLRLAIMALTLWLASVYPDIFNIFAVAGGLSLLRICIVLEDLKNKRTGETK